MNAAEFNKAVAETNSSVVRVVVYDATKSYKHIVHVFEFKKSDVMIANGKKVSARIMNVAEEFFVEGYSIEVTAK